MLFGRAGRSSYPVTSRPAAEQQYHISRHRALAAYVLRLDSAHNGPHLKPLGHIALVVDFTHMGRGKAYLVAVARIACGRLAAYLLLRQFPRERLAHRPADVPGTRDAHGLIHVSPTRERVADRASEAGCGPAERFDLRRVVVRLVLELQKPFLRLAVHVHVDIDAARVVLLADLKVFKKTLLAQVAGPDGGKFH